MDFILYISFQKQIRKSQLNEKFFARLIFVILLPKEL